MAVKVGDKVTTTAVTDWNGTRLASFVRTNTYDVIQVGGTNLSPNRIVIGKGSAVTAAVDLSTLNVVGGATEVAPDNTPLPTLSGEPVVISTGISGGSDILARRIVANAYRGSVASHPVTTINGAKVQYGDARYDANQSSDYNYAVNEVSQNRYNQLTAEQNAALTRSDPSIVQNAASFPPVKYFDSNAGYYRYNYYMDYERDTLSNGTSLSKDMGEVRKASNIDILSRSKLFQLNTGSYNKFKIPNPNDNLTKTFAHVFFVRPDCNIYAEGSSGGSSNPSLASSLETLSEFYYAKKHCPEILRQLTNSKADYNHEFMMFLSNKVRSFEIADEYITADTYGQGLTGYKIPYGKHNVESRTAKTFSISYVDDRDLHIYNLHKLWIDYISYTYRGKVVPENKYIEGRILDYPTCVYYILCAEDGETVIFWSKYWGVFPLDAPSSSFSYTAEGGPLANPELRIEYQYAWKEDFNPLSMVEFNFHASQSNLNYINTYQENKLGVGYTWAGAPFVETFNGTELLPYTFKLRFRPI